MLFNTERIPLTSGIFNLINSFKLFIKPLESLMVMFK